MSLKIETSHAKNVSNFEILISFCISYGSFYYPSKENIRLSALNTLLLNARTGLATANEATTVFKNAINAREMVFAPFDKLITRIINALNNTNASVQTVANSKTLARKIQRGQATLKKSLPSENFFVSNTAPGAPINISVYQTSFDNRIENFSKLISLLTNEPLYVPNEADLKLSRLNDLLVFMKLTNTAVVKALAPLSNALISRNKILYNPLTGLYDIQAEVKKCVKSVFGSGSLEYKQINRIKFTKSDKTCFLPVTGINHHGFLIGLTEE